MDSSAGFRRFARVISGEKIDRFERIGRVGGGPHPPESANRQVPRTPSHGSAHLRWSALSPGNPASDRTREAVSTDWPREVRADDSRGAARWHTCWEGRANRTGTVRRSWPGPVAPTTESRRVRASQISCTLPAPRARTGPRSCLSPS